MSAAAARLDDPIEHSSALGGLLAGLAIGAGAVLIGIAIVGTGGLGSVAIAAMIGAGAATGAGVGQLLGSLSLATRQTGQIKSGSGNVHINGRPAARAHSDHVECSDHAGTAKSLAQGSQTVHINGQPAARVGDRTVCDAKISDGSPNVHIGGVTETTDVIDPEVPGWLEGTVLGTGLASAVVLVGPAMALWGFLGGMIGGTAGHQLGSDLYGEGSDAQKLLAFGGGFLLGGLTARYRLQPNGGLGSNLGNVKVVPREVRGFSGKLRGEMYELPGVKTESFLYVKRSAADLKSLRSEFDSSGRSMFLKDLSSTPEKVATLKRAGFDDLEIANIKAGKTPNKDWQVHHVKPLDDGGTNSFDNLTLIKNEPYHKVISNTQKTLTKGMKYGDSKFVEWPMIDANIYPYPGS